MWVPRWLGEVYSRLYYSFGLDLFTFRDALSVSGVSSSRLMVVFSRLHSCLLLTVLVVVGLGVIGC